MYKIMLCTISDSILRLLFVASCIYFCNLVSSQPFSQIEHSILSAEWWWHYCTLCHEWVTSFIWQALCSVNYVDAHLFGFRDWCTSTWYHACKLFTNLMYLSSKHNPAIAKFLIKTMTFLIEIKYLRTKSISCILTVWMQSIKGYVTTALWDTSTKNKTYCCYILHLKKSFPPLCHTHQQNNVLCCARGSQGFQTNILERDDISRDVCPQCIDLNEASNSAHISQIMASTLSTEMSQVSWGRN